MDTYRVFISYSHKDQKLAQDLAQVLEDNGLRPLWSREITSPWPFLEVIKDFISHSHVFMPILTKAASQRGWVHQEIGYALALNVPVLPVIRGGQLPGEMLEQLHGLVLSDDPKDYRKQLSKSLFEKLVKEAQEKSHALFECAKYQVDRTRMLVEYANRVRRLGHYGQVRQQATLSSFNIPDLPLSHKEWEIRHGSYYIGEDLCELLWKERRVMEEHARVAGCSLIIYPHVELKEFGDKAKKVRLKTVLQFLESMPGDKVKVAVNYGGLPRGSNLIIVGDWFAAEAVRTYEGKGYRHTIFTRHAPTVRSKMESFDAELRHLFQEQGLAPESSREAAINALQKIIAEL